MNLVMRRSYLVVWEGEFWGLANSSIWWGGYTNVTEDIFFMSPFPFSGASVRDRLGEMVFPRLRQGYIWYIHMALKRR